MPIVSSSVQQLMTALSAALGQVVNLDDNGTLGLEFDDDVQLHIALATESQCLTVRSPLTHAGHDVTEDMCRAALSINYAHLPPGCQIALEDGSGQLVLMAVFAPEFVQPQGFVEMLGEFVSVVPALREQVTIWPGRVASGHFQFISGGA